MIAKITQSQERIQQKEFPVHTQLCSPSDEPTVETPRDSSSALLMGALNSLAIMLTHRLEMS